MDDPDADEFDWETAVTVTVVVMLSACPLDFVGTAPGAAYKPALEMNPNCLLPPDVPFTCQVTAVFERPLTDAENCCIAKAATLAGFGLTITEGTGTTPGWTVTVAVANFKELACHVAVTVTAAGLGTLAGAV
jgi:hypothetical protein